MKKRILLTRSKEDNILLERQITDSYFENTIEVLKLDIISFEDLDFDHSSISKFSNIIITSKHAAALLPENVHNHNIYVVGNVSAKILKGKDYNIKYIASSANEIYEVIDQETNASSKNNFIYLSGDYITLEMPINVFRKVIYKTNYKQQLSIDEINFIKGGVDIIPVYSINCAKTLINLLKSTNLIKNVANSRVIAISSNVAEVLRDVFSDIVIAESPGQVIDKIKEYAS